MNKYFALLVFLSLVVLLVNGCAVAGQRSHVTVYPNSEYNHRQYTQFYSYNSGDSASGSMYISDNYLKDIMKMKPTVYRATSLDKLLVACEETEGAILPPYFSHVELRFKSINYAQVLMLDSITKKPIMKCIYTRGFFCFTGGCAFEPIIRKSLTEGFDKLKAVKKEREKEPNKKFPDEISFTVD